MLYNADDASLDMSFDTKSENISTSTLYFMPENVSARAVTMTAKGKNGEKIAIDYTLTDDYMLNMSVRTEGLAQQFSPKTKTFELKWKDKRATVRKGLLLLRTCIRR